MFLWPLPLFALTLAAQTPLFEVASVRPSNSLFTPSLLCGGLNLSPESVLAAVVYRLDHLIVEAYRNEVDDFGLPQWTKDNGYFAVSVKIPPNTSTDTCRQMLRTLLAERFHMVTAVETHDVNRYFLKVAKSGLKLKPVDNPPADLKDRTKLDVKDGVTRYTFRGAPMSKVLTSLGVLVEVEAIALGFRLGVNAIVDETCLTGYYDGEFEYSVSLRARGSELAESLADALTRQLGLTLELRKAPGKVLVLRSSNRMPTEN